MKITFIGTGHGLPEKGRYRTAMMLEVGQDIYFIDVGAPIINEMLRLDKPFKNIKAVYFNHVKHPTERIPLLMRENESGRFPFPIYAPSDGDVIEL
jgi:ribonuclease BN (tRNA processing enzyme)